MTIIIGIDTGFSDIGYAAVELCAPKLSDCKIVGISHINTKASSKRKGLRSADDNFERTRQIASTLREICNHHQPAAICIEAMSFVRSASTMAKIGMAFGVVAATAVHAGCPVLSATPQEIKFAITGKKSADKKVIINAIDKMFAGVPRVLLDETKLAPTRREHPYDALGAIVACWESNEMRILRQHAGGGK